MTCKKFNEICKQKHFFEQMKNHHYENFSVRRCLNKNNPFCYNLKGSIFDGKNQKNFLKYVENKKKRYKNEIQRAENLIKETESLRLIYFLKIRLRFSTAERIFVPAIDPE